MRDLRIGLTLLLAYVLVSWALGSVPFARSLFGSAALVAAASLVLLIVLARRREWAGCQRLFWITIAIGMALWIVGHVGWAYGDLVHRRHSWLQWHTVFSLCGGILPLIALLARPHRGVRPHAVATVGIDLAAYGLLAVFVYTYFALVPNLVPAARAGTEDLLLTLVLVNRFLLLAGMVAALWFARRTSWRTTFVCLTIGVGTGFVLRIGTNMAIEQSLYQSGTVYDLAWIVPWLCYASAARMAPASPKPLHDLEGAERPASVLISAIPVLLIPVTGYGVLQLEPLGTQVDSFRVLLTSLATIGGLGLLTFRLGLQGGELQRVDARLKLLAAATEHTAELILITKADGSFEHANDAFLRALGYSRREIAAAGFVELVAPECVALGALIPRTVRQHGIWRGTLVRRRKDGSTFPAACTVAALRDTAGTITHYVGVERDVAEELRLRDQLVHSERLSAIGELVAGVAHEINNPLQTIIGCVELMLDDPDAVSRRDLEIVRREAARAGQIVRNLLAFVHRGASDRTVTDLNQIVRATAALREYHLQSCNIELVVRTTLAPLLSLVNRDEIQQIVLNLLLNAEHAISSSAGSGTITLETGANGSQHFLEVADSGPGVRPDLRGRIFEPFFTTMDVGEGTGLGLSISHGIAAAHGGSLELRESARGARFRLTLPAYVDRSVNVEERSRGEHGPVRRALVVDDELGIRRLMSRLLGRRGFDVEEAETGDAALAVAATERFSLIMCDVRMPGLGGVELFERLRHTDPDIGERFVFITGDAAPVEGLPGKAAVLSKPFTASDLDALLGRMGLGQLTADS